MLDPETVAVDAVLAALSDVLVAECATEVEFELGVRAVEAQLLGAGAAAEEPARPSLEEQIAARPPEFAAGAVGVGSRWRAAVRDAGHPPPRLGEGAGAVVRLVEGVADAPRPRDDVPVAVERPVAVDGAGRARRA